MPRRALRELLELAAVDPAEGEVAFAGSDPVFPTPYRVATAGAASLGAVGVAASAIWMLRGGRRQDIGVGLRAAAAAMRSNRYLRIDGKPPAGPWDPLSGFYPVREGRWVNLHCNFPQHRAAAMSVLGCNAAREAAERASRGWDGAALEDAVHAAGGCAGLARSAAEWALHPHAASVAAQPLLELRRIGEAPPEPLGEAPRPLSGVRVLDLTRVLAGPTCARTLAEHGADALKVSAAHLADSGAMETDTGLGKLSARIDLRAAAGVDALRTLLAGADVFSQSYRPGALAARGFSAQDAARLRPGIVYVTLSAWGGAGPWRARRGFDSIVQTVSGMALAQGDGDKPKLMPVSAIDYVSGYLMAFGAMVALARRAREGGSWEVRVSLARTGRWIVERGLEPGWRGAPAELPAPELAGLMAETSSPLGRIGHLGPVLRLSETAPRWTRPPVPLGTHPAEWPTRSSPPSA